MTYSQLKKKTLENMASLEVDGVVKKSNLYQDMLNFIAKVNFSGITPLEIFSIVGYVE